MSRYENIYLLNVDYDVGHCLMSIKDEKELWYRKLGHVSMRHIIKLSTKDLVRGLPKIKHEKFELCNVCSLDIQVRSNSVVSSSFLCNCDGVNLRINFSCWRGTVTC